MPTPPYPLHPEPMSRSWLEQHPYWKIPLGCLTLIFLIVLFGGVTITIAMASLRHSEVYRQAVARAEENAEVRAQVGEPIQAAWLVSGQLHVNGSTGDANLSIPIAGPRGKALIRAVALKIGGVWRFSYLRVSFEGRAGCVDLLSVEPPAQRDF